MTKSQSNFCANVLRYYDLVVQFDGVAPRNVAAPKSGDETFAQWCKRVLGDEVENVRVFRPQEVNGRTRMKTLADEGRELKQLVQETKARVRSAANEKVAQIQNDLVEVKKTVSKELKKKVAVVRARAEQDIQTAHVRAAQVPIQELQDLLMDLNLDPATQQFLDRLIAKAGKDPFPLGVVLRGLVDRRVLAVAAARENERV